MTDPKQRLLRQILFVLLLFGLIGNFLSKPPVKPRLVVVFIVDQLSYNYFWKVQPWLRGGLAKLQTGVSFCDALQPNPMPSTPTGHATISTGALPMYHGITGYGYLGRDNQYHLVTEDSPKRAAVFGLSGPKNVGIGPDHLECDTICDTFVQTSTPGAKALAYCFALKPRASVMLAGHLGKAIWFDEEDRRLTSSAAYFKSLPQWLMKVNRLSVPSTKTVFNWKTIFNSNSKAYQFDFVDNYQFAGKQQMIGRPIILDPKAQDFSKNFCMSPLADQMLFRAAEACLRENLGVGANNKNSRMLLFISFSTFDLTGHIYGPDAREQLDLLYRLDKHIGRFITQAQSLVGRDKVAFCLTADHGGASIPEILNKKGMLLAKRLDAKKLATKMNDWAKKELGLESIVKKFEAPQFYLDKVKLAELGEKNHAKLIKGLVTLLSAEPGVKSVLTRNELLNPVGAGADRFKLRLAEQMWHARAGDIVILTEPFVQLTEYDSGTSHSSPYRYDTHVPLCFYQSGAIESGKKVWQPVALTQLAPTLAAMLGCPVPACATAGVLPSILE